MGLESNHNHSQSSSTSGAINPGPGNSHVSMNMNTSNASNHNHNHSHNNNHNHNPYLQQIMMNQSVLSQHHGSQNQNQLLYQNSLLDVANMINPLQVLPPMGSASANNVPIPISNSNKQDGLGNACITHSHSHAHNVHNTHNAHSHPMSTATPSTMNSLLSTNQNPNPTTHQATHPTTQSIGSAPSPATFSSMINQSPATTLGGVRIPPVPPNTTTAQQVQIAAAAAAAEAAPPKGYHGPTPGGVRNRDAFQMMGQNEMNAGKGGAGGQTNKRTKRNSSSSELTEEEKKQLNRDRNRQHARSTRLRKKAYVNKLKELVDGLHAERSEEARKRRVAVQHLAEVQNIRRKVISKFLQYHSGYEHDTRKWETILEEGFYVKQPLTPFRSFQTKEIEQSGDRDCRISMGVDSIICDSASLSVMIENVGIRSARWQHIKRDEFLCREEAKRGKAMPGSIERENSRLQHAISSLSSSSGSSISNGSGSDEEKRKQQLMVLNRLTTKPSGQNQNHANPKKVSSSSSGGSSSLSNQPPHNSNNDFHDYHAQPLPDPRLDGGSTDSDSPTNASDNAVVGKHLCAYSSSSGEDEKPLKKSDQKQRVSRVPPNVEIPAKRNDTKTTTNIHTNSHKPTTHPQMNTTISTIHEEIKPVTAVTDPSVSSNSEKGTSIVKPVPTRSSLPPNIARTGGIAHNIRPAGGDLNARLSTAPVIPLPPFAGIGKQSGPKPSALIPSTSINSIHRPNKVNHSTVPSSQTTNYAQSKAPVGPSIVSKGTINNRNDRSRNRVSSGVHNVIIDPDSGTASSDDTYISIQAHYHVNEDDMLLTDNVLMCPFIFRTQDAVLCGALAECIVPGMLRAEFSERNKLVKLEMVYDAMGFMQQLERASGNEGNAHIVPNSLDTSLQPNAEEARVITTATPPFLIVSVNERWTQMTKYTQMEAEKKELSILHGKRTDVDAGKRQGKPIYDPSLVAKGQPACCTNLYYDKFGRAFIAFVSSYPVSK